MCSSHARTQLAERALGRRLRGGDLLRALEQRVHQLLADQEQQLVLGRDVVIEPARGQPGRVAAGRRPTSRGSRARRRRVRRRRRRRDGGGRSGRAGGRVGSGAWWISERLLGIVAAPWTSISPTITRCCARRSASSRAIASRPSPASSTRTQVVPVRDRARARRARPDGDPVPGAVRRRRRRHARLRARRRGARAGRLLGGDHRVRAHLAGHGADLPVRQRGAEAGVDAGAVQRRAPRRLRPDRARGGNGRRQHADPRAPRRRRVGDRRRQAVHHQRRHRRSPGLVTITALHRRGGDLEPDRAQRHAGLRAGRALPQDGLERLRHAPAALHRLPRARREPARRARRRAAPVPHGARRRAHRRRGDGRRPRPGGARPGARLRARAPGVRPADLALPDDRREARRHVDARSRRRACSSTARPARRISAGTSRSAPRRRS